MVDFHELRLNAAAESDAFIAETGGLPEIDAAAASLREAIEQTRIEIAEAEFASRFPNPPSDNFNLMAEHAGLTPMTEAAIAEEGEAGLKRASLNAGLTRIENQLGTLINQLVELRTDLVVSKQEF